MRPLALKLTASGAVPEVGEAVNVGADVTVGKGEGDGVVGLVPYKILLTPVIVDESTLKDERRLKMA